VTTLLSIGELAERTGVATTALRYYDELGLVAPVTRVSGRRRYAVSAVADVGAILLFREVGFSLSEIASLVAGNEEASWRGLVERKLAELAEQQRRVEIARIALEHTLQCPAGDPMRCDRFWSIVDKRLAGVPLDDPEART
jgi:DNA-binding transcriptional MerR regulator